MYNRALWRCAQKDVKLSTPQASSIKSWEWNIILQYHFTMPATLKSISAKIVFIKIFCQRFSSCLIYKLHDSPRLKLQKSIRYSYYMGRVKFPVGESYSYIWMFSYIPYYSISIKKN